MKIIAKDVEELMSEIEKESFILKCCDHSVADYNEGELEGVSFIYHILSAVRIIEQNRDESEPPRTFVHYQYSEWQADRYPWRRDIPCFGIIFLRTVVYTSMDKRKIEKIFNDRNDSSSKMLRDVNPHWIPKE